jgi:hypothetical protein
MIKADFKHLQQMDGIKKECRLPGADFTLADDNGGNYEQTLQIRHYLDSDGDMNLVILKTHGGTLTGYSSVRNTLKQSAKSLLADIFGIRNSSALRNLKCDGDYFKLPILVSNEATTIIAVKYSYLKTHPEVCPDYDFSQIDSFKSFTDLAIESLEEGEHLVIYENYQYPEECGIYPFPSQSECRYAFDDLCRRLQDGVKDPEYAGGRVLFPHGEDLDSQNPCYGDVAITLIDEMRTAKFTMVSSDRNVLAA